MVPCKDLSKRGVQTKGPWMSRPTQWRQQHVNIHWARCPRPHWKPLACFRHTRRRVTREGKSACRGRARFFCHKSWRSAVTITFRVKPYSTIPGSSSEPMWAQRVMTPDGSMLFEAMIRVVNLHHFVVTSLQQLLAFSLFRSLCFSFTTRDVPKGYIFVESGPSCPMKIWYSMPCCLFPAVTEVTLRRISGWWSRTAGRAELWTVHIFVWGRNSLVKDIFFAVWKQENLNLRLENGVFLSEPLQYCACQWQYQFQHRDYWHSSGPTYLEQVAKVEPQLEGPVSSHLGDGLRACGWVEQIMLQRDGETNMKHAIEWTTWFVEHILNHFDRYFLNKSSPKTDQFERRNIANCLCWKHLKVEFYPTSGRGTSFAGVWASSAAASAVRILKVRPNDELVGSW